MKRITKLTDAQKARFDEWADKWIEIGLRTGSADRERFETAVRECYRYAGLEQPKVIVWTTSPLAVALAGPIASYLIARSRNQIDAVRGAVGDAVGDAVDGAVGDAVRDVVGDAVGDAVVGAVRGAVDGSVVDAVDGAVRGAVRGAVGDAVVGAVGDAVVGAVDGAVVDAVDGAVVGAVRDAVVGAVDGAVVGAVRDVVGDAVVGAVVDVVGGAVGDAVGDAVVDAVDGAVVGAVRDVVGDAVGDAVVGAVRGAVVGAVRGAVGDAVGDAVECIRRMWSSYMGGQFWVSGWWYGGAFTSYFREVCGLELDGDLWERGRAYEATMESACWWFPHKDFVIVSERPTAIHREPVDPNRLRGFGSHRLHCETGPAVEFADGWGVWSWHGVTVTKQIIEHPETLTIDDVRKEENAEVRRVMIERMGWERFCDQAKMRLIHEDELNTNFSTVPVSTLVDEGQRLVTTFRAGTEKAQLLESEEMRDFEDRPLRFVRLTDPSTGRQYTLRVKHSHKRAYEAVAWTFQMTEKQYKTQVLQHS